MKKITLISAILVASCTTPMGLSDAPMMQYDRDTKYGITESDDGFAMTVFYSRYQFIPEGDTVATSCKQQLMAIAYEHADASGKEIEPINEQRIRISMGRNSVSGISSCQAYGEAKWSDVDID